MVLSLSELHNCDFQLSGINIFHQKPRYRILDVNKRPTNGFLLILHGSCTYEFAGGSFDLGPGCVVYLPYQSVHKLTIQSEQMEFFRIDFHLTVDGEVVLFSKTPQKLCSMLPEECATAAKTMLDHCQFVSNSVWKAELMCTIFRSLAAKPVNARRERLFPAIQYLLEHLTEKIDCKQLAYACSLSSAQFYNLFREEYRMTPLEYRDSLLTNRATVLLQDGAFSVAEVAEILGFESVSYFSRFFKKHRGISPSRVQKK